VHGSVTLRAYRKDIAMPPKFKLGRVVMTPLAVEALQDAEQSPEHFLELHASGSWGDLCAEDRRLNDAAIAHEGDPDRRGRVLSTYITSLGTKLYVITEHDRSVTTILLPEEY
jgi:hypothetical protein